MGAARDLADVYFFLFETECQFYAGWQCTQLTNNVVYAFLQGVWNLGAYQAESADVTSPQ